MNRRFKCSHPECGLVFETQGVWSPEFGRFIAFCPHPWDARTLRMGWNHEIIVGGVGSVAFETEEELST